MFSDCTRDSVSHDTSLPRGGGGMEARASSDSKVKHIIYTCHSNESIDYIALQETSLAK